MKWILIAAALLLLALAAMNVPRCKPGQIGPAIGSVFKITGC